MVVISNKSSRGVKVFFWLAVVASVCAMRFRSITMAPVWQDIVAAVCEQALTSQMLERYVRRELSSLRARWKEAYVNWQKKWSVEGVTVEKLLLGLPNLSAQARAELVNIPFYVVCEPAITITDEEMLANVMICSDVQAQSVYEKIDEPAAAQWADAVRTRTGWFASLEKVLFIRDKNHDDGMWGAAEILGLKTLGTVWHEMMHVIQHANALAACKMFGYNEKVEGPLLLTSENAFSGASHILMQRQSSGKYSPNDLYSAVVDLESEADTRSVEYFPNKAGYIACSEHKNALGYHKLESKGYISNDTCIELAQKHMGMNDEVEYQEFCKKLSEKGGE